MHEMSAAQSILEIALGAAQDNGAGRVLSIRLVVGELTGYSGEILDEYFQGLAEDTAAAGAWLDVRRAPIRLRCQDCETEFEIETADGLASNCPACQSPRSALTGGREFLVESVEIE
jgi:hydrogenase nickel incorporation protein HypA/HybF